MKVTLENIKQSLPVSKNKVSSFWVRLWVRKFSYLVTYVCLKMGLSANTVSVISAIDALLGCIFLSINNRWFMLAGVILINFWIVLDCVDGNIARFQKQATRSGEFFDAISGYVVCAFAYLSVGIAAFHSSSLLGEYQYIFIILGALASITDLYSRLIYQKYTCTCLMIAQQDGLTDYTAENDNFEKDVKPTGFTYFRLVFDRQTGISALFMPLLIISYIFSCFEYMTIFYSLYHCAALVFVFYSYLKKASKL